MHIFYIKNAKYGKIILIIGFLWFLLALSCKKETKEEYAIMSGYFKQSIIEPGELEAIKATHIIMPYLKWEFGYLYKLIGLTEHGQVVRKGDTIIRIDQSSIYKYIINKEEELENELAAVNKQRIQMENSIQELQSQLKSEQATYDLKKLELEKIQFESESKKRVKELEFQQAGIKLEKVKRNLESKPILENYELTIQQIKVAQYESDINAAKEALNMLFICSPNNGIFQVAQNYRRQNIRLGDDIYLGSKIASIPDISKMKVLSYVDETDINKIKIGMKVIVRLDALSSVPFNGNISHISLVCTALEKQKVFKTEIEIQESDLRLKPGMTVSCEYICHESDNVHYVPNNCLLKERNLKYIFPEKGRPEKLEVKTGPSNSHYTIVLSDVKPGLKLIPVEKINHQKIN